MINKPNVKPGLLNKLNFTTMSVLVLDPQVYKLVFDKAMNYQYKREVTQEYCEIFRSMSEEDIKQVIITLCNLNEESFDKRYKQEPDKVKQSKFINLRFDLPKINCFQMLKYLQCINYNIEIETIERELTSIEKDSMKILNIAIEEIKQHIISEIPEYKQAQWSNLV